MKLKNLTLTLLAIVTVLGGFSPIVLAKITNPSSSGSSLSAVVDDTTPTLGGDLDAGGFSISNLLDFTSTGTTSMRTLAIVNGSAQSITSAGTTITASSTTYIDLVPDADYVLTSTPNIQDGSAGQVVLFHNDSAFTITFQDESALTGSNIMLGGADATLRPNSQMLLRWDSSESAWFIISNPNTSVAGANASTIEVRNTSGSTIAAGSPVYITGFNTGQNRITVGLADADGAGTSPAIGITATAISNNGNGQVISAGNAVGIVNTSSWAVNDNVYVSTTAGTLTNVRPTGDACVQSVGRVTRVATSGNIEIIGAGRCADVPNYTTIATRFLGGASFGSTATTTITTAGYVGIASSTPQRTLSVSGAAVTQECSLTDGATITLNMANCNQARVTLGGNRTLDITNETQAMGQAVRLIVCQDGTGSRTMTWDSAILWAGGTAPTLTTTANKCDVLAGFTTMATGTAKVFLGVSQNF